MDVVQLVKEGKCRFEWAEIVSEYSGYKLYIKVLRDAMKFDDVPAMTWNFKPIPGDNRTFDGVRLPASSHQLQEIADLLGAMLLTPKVIDLIWLQAELRFNCITQVNGVIVANTHIHDIHEEIEKTITKLGGDAGAKLISCVGKYWCLINDLNWYGPIHGDIRACNYGWMAKKASGPGVTPGTQCWQRPGFRHGKSHWDPSQTIRLMKREALLESPDGTVEAIDLHNVAANTTLAPLLHHQPGALTYLRQGGVTQLEPLPEKDFVIIKKKKKGLLDKLFGIFKRV